MWELWTELNHVQIYMSYCNFMLQDIASCYLLSILSICIWLVLIIELHRVSVATVWTKSRQDKQIIHTMHESNLKWCTGASLIVCTVFLHPEHRRKPLNNLPLIKRDSVHRYPPSIKHFSIQRAFAFVSYYRPLSPNQQTRFKGVLSGLLRQPSEFTIVL